LRKNKKTVEKKEIVKCNVKPVHWILPKVVHSTLPFFVHCKFANYIPISFNYNGKIDNLQNNNTR
jgi:hypothetical protein